MYGGIDMGLVGGGDSSFTYKTLMFSVAIMILLPLLLTNLAPAAYNGASEDEVLSGYERMTGQAADTKVSVWPLTGIYTPFTGGFVDETTGQTITYNFTDDGWLYGSAVNVYTPFQYSGTAQDYTVYKADDGVFRYWQDSKDYNETYGTGHQGHWGIATQADVDAGKAEHVGDRFERDTPGDLYSEVSFDINHKSGIFFVESSRQDDSSGHFTYDYEGYRMSFQPISNYTAINQDGQKIPIVATTTSLSLVWYQTASQSGITGQIVLSGSNGGIAYLNAARIISAFNTNTSTAAFDMVFNGVVMNIIVKIDPMATTTYGMTIEQAYNAGYWSIMVTSLSADSTAYTGTDNATNPMKIFETMVDLLTFNMDDYNISPWLATLCSFVFVAPLYVALITLCLGNIPLLILVGILAAVQAIGSFWPF